VKAVQGVRQPVSVRAGSRRTLDQHLTLRFPSLATPLLALFARLPPESGIRRRLAARTVRQAFEAYNRRDLEAVTIGFHPEVEWRPYREFVEAGLAEPVYRGPAGYRAYIEATQEVWGDEVRVEPTALIDLGDRLVVLGNMPMRAQASGIALAETYACVSTLVGGRLIRQQDFLTHAEALESVGLVPSGSG
jgi:ketosteroid isomerase-like protein